MTTTYFFGVCGSDVCSGGVEGQFPASGVTYFYAPVQLPTYATGSVTPANGYVAEDDVTFYVAEDGVTFYVQEM